MRRNVICKTLFFAACLFANSVFAKEDKSEKTVISEKMVVKKDKFSNSAVFDNKLESSDKDIFQYAAVSDDIFTSLNKDDNELDNYIVALSTSKEDVNEFPMIRAKIVGSKKDCNDAQIVLNKETYSKLSKNNYKADIVWSVVNSKGDFKLKVNYQGFGNFTYIGIPAEEIEKEFEQRAREMVLNDIEARSWPWDNNGPVEYYENPNGSNTPYYLAAFSIAGAAGLVCFVGYKNKAKRMEEAEGSLAIPELPALDSTINTISDHPDGLPRVDIYNPPLEFYHFPMDTSYDIVDIRPDFYD